ELMSRPPRIHTDYLTPTNANLLSVALLGGSTDHYLDPHPFSSLLPQGYHLVYFPPAHPTASLLPDGTDTDHSPGSPFTRRVWAGGSVTFHRGWEEEVVLDGAVAGCLETIKDVRIKGTPGAGEKILVDIVRQYGWRQIAHEMRQQRLDGASGAECVMAEPAIEETRTLCFMTPKTADEARRDVEEPHRRVIKAPAYEPTYTLTLTPTPSLLFRFSALTFNAHAIHLDRQHCREVEGYRDLLVHGPLLLTLMFCALREAIKCHAKETLRIKTLDYRNLAPVYVNEEIKVCVREGKGQNWDVWIVGPTGGLCVKGTAI
ncbi:hypothetical protein M406DRAFT_27011, partial [Cryphonectria parasitica EP155]